MDRFEDCEPVDIAKQRASERSRTNRAYSERNYAVILAAKLAVEAGYKAGWGIDGNESWDDD